MMYINTTDESLQSGLQASSHLLCKHGEETDMIHGPPTWLTFTASHSKQQQVQTENATEINQVNKATQTSQG